MSEFFPKEGSFQLRVYFWMMRVWSARFFAIANNKRERNFRFMEESLELVQSLGMTREDVNEIVEYVYNRDIGEPVQETGGVMVTLAALCTASEIDMFGAAETELARIYTPEIIEKIRRKHEFNPDGTPRGYNRIGVFPLQSTKAIPSIETGVENTQPITGRAYMQRFVVTAEKQYMQCSWVRHDETLHIRIEVQNAEPMNPPKKWIHFLRDLADALSRDSVMR